MSVAGLENRVASEIGRALLKGNKPIWTSNINTATGSSNPAATAQMHAGMKLRQRNEKYKPMIGKVKNARAKKGTASYPEPSSNVEKKSQLPSRRAKAG